MSFPVFFFFCLLLSSYRVFCPGPFTPKSTLTQLKIHFVWPKSEGVCTMGLLHTALKLVLWRRMGYYYLPATHPAIKTSGATSPQRSAAALPSSHSLALVLHEPHTTERLALNSTSATLLQRQTQDSHSTLLCFTSRLWIFLPGCFFFSFLDFFFFFFWMGFWAWCVEHVNGLARKESSSFLSIRQSDAGRSSEEQQGVLVIWKYGDAWGASSSWRKGRWRLPRAEECRGADQDMCTFQRMPDLWSMGVCVCTRLLINRASQCAYKLALVWCYSVHVCLTFH